MAWLNEQQIEDLNFIRVGKNVKISDKASIHQAELMIIGDDSRIDDFVVISGRVTIGKNVHIAVFCNVAGGSEGVVFEDFSGLAYGCHVFTQSDDYSGGTLTNPTVPAIYKSELKKKVVIGKHCIVGAKSIVLPGVIMNEGCALGAMSMLSKSTEPWSIYFGIPAKKIKNRKKDLLTMENMFHKDKLETTK